MLCMLHTGKGIAGQHKCIDRSAVVKATIYYTSVQESGHAGLGDLEQLNREGKVFYTCCHENGLSCTTREHFEHNGTVSCFGDSVVLSRETLNECKVFFFIV